MDEIRGDLKNVRTVSSQQENVRKVSSQQENVQTASSQQEIVTKMSRLKDRKTEQLIEPLSETSCCVNEIGKYKYINYFQIKNTFQLELDISSSKTYLTSY